LTKTHCCHYGFGFVLKSNVSEHLFQYRTEQQLIFSTRRLKNVRTFPTGKDLHGGRMRAESHSAAIPAPHTAVPQAVRRRRARAARACGRVSPGEGRELMLVVCFSERRTARGALHHRRKFPEHGFAVHCAGRRRAPRVKLPRGGGTAQGFRAAQRRGLCTQFCAGAAWVADRAACRALTSDSTSPRMGRRAAQPHAKRVVCRCPGTA